MFKELEHIHGLMRSEKWKRAFGDEQVSVVGAQTAGGAATQEAGHQLLALTQGKRNSSETVCDAWERATQLGHLVTLQQVCKARTSSH